MKVAIINGPNLDQLGLREKSIYGNKTLKDLEQECISIGNQIGISVAFFQSNVEGELISYIHDCRKYEGLIINGAGYSHTSIAIMDALLILDMPIIEVHISNTFKREEFRHNSYIAKIANGVIYGFGTYSYVLALKAIKELICIKKCAS